MTKNYDNWARLVTAVVRRERDRRIALSHSRDHSSISSTSSSSFDLNLISSTSQTFDHHHLNSVLVVPETGHYLSMDYSDLTLLDHNEWKTMLPPGNHQVMIWTSSSLSFFLDKWSRRNCFSVGATNLIMSSRDNVSENCWENKHHPESRYLGVAELKYSRHLYIECVIKIWMLSPHTLYAAYLVFGFTDNHAKLHSAVSIIRNFSDESGLTYPDEQARIVQFGRGNVREEDEWMEIELGDFYAGPGENGEVQVQLLDTSGHWKRGLIVEGIEFRPLTLREIRRQLPTDYSDLTLDHSVWKAMLPFDKKEVVWRSASMSFFLHETTEKNCFLLGAASILMSSGDEENLLVETKPHSKSRFSEVIELQPCRFLDIQGRIKTRMLSPGTIYTAYLVFGFAVNNAGLVTANSIIRSFREGDINYDPTSQARLVGGGHVVDSAAACWSRGDEWIEVALGHFYVRLGHNENVVVQVLNLSESGTSGLIVEGIEFRPSREKGSRSS